MPSNHALRTRTTGALYVTYAANDGNLAVSGGSMFVPLWVRCPVSAATKSIVYVAGNNGFELHLYGESGTGTVKLRGPNANIATWAGGYAAIRDGNWHFVVIENDYSGGAANGVVRLWVDGETKAQVTGLTWTGPTSFTTFCVGQNTFGNYAEADIDDLHVFAGYSTEAERDAAYNGGDGSKALTDDDFANGTRRFYASFDANSATADYAAGTAAPTGGTASFTNGFWFGDETWLTTTQGPDDPFWSTHGERLYEPNLDGNPHGYEDWSLRKGTYSEPAGGFRVTAASGALEAFCDHFSFVLPAYVHLRFRTSGLATDQYVQLLMTAADSRGVGSTRRWDLRIYSDRIRGKDDYNAAAVDTEAWVDLKVWAGPLETTNYTVGAYALVNDEYEVELTGSLTDATWDVQTPVLRFVGASLTGSPYIEVASLGIHSYLPPLVKETAHDTFPDEYHLATTSNAGRQTIAFATEHPFTDLGVVWEGQVGTWSQSGVWFTSSIYDSDNDRLLIWAGGAHNVSAGWPSPLPSGMYRYNIGFGMLDLSAWPTVGSVAQGAVVYRPDTPHLYPHLPGVIDDHEGRRILLCTQYHLPDSAINAGQCRGDIVVGLLTGDTSLALLRGGEPVVTPASAPSFADTQLSGAPPVYNAEAPRGMRYQLWSQAYGERNAWGAGGASAALRPLYLATGDSLDSLGLWPSGLHMLALWNGAEHLSPCLRSGDDYAGLLTTSGTHYLHVVRARAPMLMHPAEKLPTWQPAHVLSHEVIPDTARGVWHCPYSYDHQINYAYMRLDGFDWIGIDAGQTTGSVETVTMQKPSGGWGSLRINVDADAVGQTVEVAVIDPGTGTAVTGYAQADCDDVTVDDTDKEVTWGSGARKLSQLANATLRLRFHLTRANAGDATPRLYSYRVAEWPSVPVAAGQAKAARAADLYV